MTVGGEWPAESGLYLEPGRVSRALVTCWFPVHAVTHYRPLTIFIRMCRSAAGKESSWGPLAYRAVVNQSWDFSRHYTVVDGPKQSQTRNLLEMPSLSDLPYDCQACIFTWLTKKDLHALCSVNRNLHASAVPHLYHTVEWTWQERYGYMRIPAITPPVALFLRTILHRPELGTHVRQLVCNGRSFYSGMFGGKWPPKITVGAAVVDEAAAFVGHLDVPFSTLWLEEIRSGTMDACMSLLLLHLPYLTHLNMQPSFTKETRILGMVLRSSLCDAEHPSIQPILQHVRDLTFTHEIDHRAGQQNQIVRNTADVLPLFYLPKLKHMDVSISNTTDFAWPPTMPPTPSTLVSLELSTIREGCLGHVLQATRHLPSLHWKWHYNPTSGLPYDRQFVDCDQICEDLSHVKASLSQLTIHAENEAICVSDPLELSRRGSLRPLRSFLNLKELNCPQFFLFGYPGSRADRLGSVLPPSLEHLTINDSLNCSEYMEYEDMALMFALREWLDSFSTSNPMLRSLHLELNESAEWAPELRQEIRELCSDVGLRFSMVKKLKDIKPLDDYVPPVSEWQYQWL